MVILYNTEEIIEFGEGPPEPEEVRPKQIKPYALGFGGESIVHLVEDGL